MDPAKRTLYSYVNPEEERLARSIANKMYRYNQINLNRLASMEEISDSQVQRFWNEGYLVVENALSADEVQQGIEGIMDIVYGKVEGPRVQFVKSQAELKTDQEKELAARKIHHYIDYEPRLRDISLKPEVMAALKRLFGEPAKVVQDQGILKPPSGGAEKPWHQDMAYGPLAYNKPVIGIWFALDRAELDNGCMHIIPYSHREGAAPHYAVRDWQLCDSSVLVERDVPVPLDPGAVLIFHGLLHHGTPPNFSNKRRRSIQVHYAPDSATKLSPQEYKRIFTNEMSNAEC